MWGDTLSRNDGNKMPINAAQQPRTEKLLPLFKKNQLDALISQIYFGMKLYMFRAVPLPIIRSLFIVQDQDRTSWS